MFRMGYSLWMRDAHAAWFLACCPLFLCSFAPMLLCADRSRMSHLASTPPSPPHSLDAPSSSSSPPHDALSCSLARFSPPSHAPLRFGVLTIPLFIDTTSSHMMATRSLCVSLLLRLARRCCIYTPSPPPCAIFGLSSFSVGHDSILIALSSLTRLALTFIPPSSFFSPAS
ncbi:hypothetical protein MSAN_02149700 [Mycena sanguinolenta]|uniref:Uncharacterized protein n=1 Tax=Mycena sanguinolenta TaxID=230812 RepID=A0A8H7CL63_9AGAR|nr:hypothetical protein MSAN_02149700 [Mycena sanguinolenta]